MHRAPVSAPSPLLRSDRRRWLASALATPWLFQQMAAQAQLQQLQHALPPGSRPGQQPGQQPGQDSGHGPLSGTGQYL